MPHADDVERCWLQVDLFGPAGDDSHAELFTRTLRDRCDRFHANRLKPSSAGFVEEVPAGASDLKQIVCSRGVRPNQRDALARLEPAVALQRVVVAARVILEVLSRVLVTGSLAIGVEP